MRQPRDLITQPRHGYVKVRALHDAGWGLPWMLDPSRNLLMPYACDEWHRTRDGRWLPVLRGGVGFSGRGQLSGGTLLPALGVVTAISQQGIALDSAYTAGSAGDAIRVKYTPTADATLTAIYFYIVSYTGTAANVNDINFEVRPGTGLPDTGTLTGSGSVDPASATGWIALTGLSISLTGGTTYSFIIADADGNGTDFATVLRNANSAFNFGGIEGMLWTAGSTADGWGSETAPSRLGAMVAVIGGASYGSALAANGTVTSNTLQKGLLIDGVTEQLEVYGFITGAVSANYTGVNLWEGTNGPGGSADAVADNAIRVSGSLASPHGFRFDTFETLAKSSQYRFVFTYGGNTATPNKYSIGTGSVAAIQAAMLGGGTWYWTEEVAGPAWSDDDDAYPNMALLVEDQVAITAGAAGGMHVIDGYGVIR